MTVSAPPRPSLTLNVGITGHRAHVLSDAIVTELQTRIDSCFARLAEAAVMVGSEMKGIFSDEPPCLRLHTALATGADQLAATAAKQRGYRVRALLPFPAEEYGRDFADASELQEFSDQLNSANSYFALPGTREDDVHAYVMVGKAVIAAADVLIAVWDGKDGNGPGGTSHVVDLALQGRVPVLHVPIDRESETLGKTRLLIGGDIRNPVIGRLDSEADLQMVVREVLAPDPETDLGGLREFYEEREILINPRIEYPLLLAILGVKRLSSAPWKQTSLADASARSGGERGETSSRQMLSFEWANFLAIRYAQMSRSGHITNYMLSALAVLAALAGLLLPSAKPLMVIDELVIIGLLLLNVRAGSAGEWQRKWLQYRYLAESLRPLSYLKQTGLVGPPFRHLHASMVRGGGTSGDWMRWYAAAIWREMPSTVGTMAFSSVRRIADDVIRTDIEHQMAYHWSNATRMHKLDHRLHLVGQAVISAVIAACGFYLALYWLAPHLLESITYGFVFITVGFPALGAAVFGMRGHGEHLLAASRSANTARSLAVNAEKLSEVRDIEALAGELERTAEIMLSDLDEWTVAYGERSRKPSA